MSRVVSNLARNSVLVGDAGSRLRQLPDGSVDCVVTSPPYFRLRDYGHPAQLGLEDHVDGWVRSLRGVMRQVARVLVPTGTVWLNLGDAFSTHAREGAPRKGLLLAPERLALALMSDGWLVRNKVVWAKRSTVPSSVRDRLSTTHEFIYLLARRPRYHFDLDAIRLPHTSQPSKPRRAKLQEPARSPWLGPNSDGDAGLRALHQAGLVGHPLGKNPGDVWSMSVSRYRGGHCATYPEPLVERALLAGCPETRCQACRRPWVRRLRRRPGSASRLPLAPSCGCQAGSEPGLVCDPFLGSGTTAVVGERLGRDWLGIELNPQFAALARQRIEQARRLTAAA